MKTAAKATIVILLVFIVGFFSGIGTLASFQALRPDNPLKKNQFFQRPFKRNAPRSVERIKQLAQELELTSEQQEQFEPILQAGMEKIKKVRRKHRPEIREILLQTRSQLRSILNEKQCKRFDEISPAIHPGRDFSGPGRCLQKSPAQKQRRGQGRGRRMRQQGNIEQRAY